jgi:hypothetical protein
MAVSGWSDRSFGNHKSYVLLHRDAFDKTQKCFKWRQISK